MLKISGREVNQKEVFLILGGAYVTPRFSSIYQTLISLLVLTENRVCFSIYGSWVVACCVRFFPFLQLVSDRTARVHLYSTDSRGSYRRPSLGMRESGLRMRS